MTDLDVLWRQVRHVAQARVAVVEAAAEALRQGSPDAAPQVERAVEECHKLVGSLGSYGRPGGSELALAAAGLLEAGHPDPERLDDVVARLRAAVDG